MKKILTILLLLCFQLNAVETLPQGDSFPLEDFLEGPGTPNQNNETIKIDQARIIDKMIRYLQINQRDTAVVNKGGVCNGLAFLVQYYASLNLEYEFFIALESMSAWDEKKESLKAPSRIPHMYATLGNLFDQWINDISWFQQTYVQIASLPTFELSNQRRRIQQYEMIKRSDETRQISLLSSPIMYSGMTKPQLAELLEIWSWYPNTIVEFGGQRHATSSRILADGRIFYYDPNIPKCLRPFDSYDELAYLIQETKYKFLGFPSEKMNIEIMAYQYVEQGEKPFIPAAIPAIRQWKTGNQSPNRFTPFHIAIYANDIDYLRSLLQQPSLNPNQADSMGVTPLYLATQLWKPDFVRELLKHPKIDIHHPTRLSPIMAAVANYNVDAVEALLYQGADLFVTSDEKLGIEDILKEPTMTKLLKIPAIIMCYMKQEELEFVKELCRRVPEIVLLQDAYGNNLQYYAALFENYALYEVLANAEDLLLYY